MSRVASCLPMVLLLLLAVGLLSVPAMRAAEVGYVEDFALARDREAALRQLIPGTEDFYYFHALHYLNTGQAGKLDELTRPWHDRFGQSARLTEIQTRAALLGYEKNPKATLDYLTSRLGMRFDHQKETLGTAPDLPTALSPTVIARTTMRDDSLRRWGNLDNFEDAALDWLAAENLNWDRRRALLSRLQRPDVPNLPKLVADDLGTPDHPQSFGAYQVHAMMTLPQLDALLKSRPELLNQQAFVNSWIAKLHPGADADFPRDRAVTRSYLERLEGFVKRLDPVHNPLKAHVLFHRLALDRADNTFDKARFAAYLQLPRQQPYMSRTWNERETSQRFPANLGADFASVTLLPVAGADEALVRSYLKRFIVDGVSLKEFEPYLDDMFLKHLFAETNVELGRGDMEAWATQLPPDQYARLKERVDIDFAFTNKSEFAADEPVHLDLFVKNAPNLLVKVFEINAANFYRTQQREIDTDINLDGLVPNTEQAHKFDEPPFRRVPRGFDFPQLSKPGVYVIDFIGSGKSSRALVRKGRLRPVTGTGTAGQTVTVLDEANKPVAGAGVWLGGREYVADGNGVAVVPFSSQPGRRAIVLSRGDFACLDHVQHQPENYRLIAGIHVDRESLLTQQVAQVLIRPGLFLNNQPVSLKLLEEVKLRIIATDHAGIPTSTEVPDFKLFEDRETIHEFRVPARLASLNVTLTAKVKSLSVGQPVDLAANRAFALNDIEKSDKVEDLHLARFDENWVVELLGRTGEAKPDRPVHLALKHRDFKEPARASLKTDARGRVTLGPLADIVSVTATGPEGTAHTWALPEDRHTFRAAVHGKAGETVSVPYLGTAAKPTRDEFALLEVRGNVVLNDRFDNLDIKDGMLELRTLPAGDYDLWLKRTGDRLRVRLTEGTASAGYLMGKTRELQVPGLKPVQIASVAAEGDTVAVRLRDVNPFARVHLIATRYRPAFAAFADLGVVRDAELGGAIPTRPESVYLTGRNIGDEYRYVLDRRGLKKFPGNMLDRPQLLLNPWAIRTTDSGEQMAMDGEMFGAKGTDKLRQELARAMPQSDSAIGSGRWGSAPAIGDFADLDFLADPSAVLVNLVPDKDGLVRVPRAKIGPHAMLSVVVVDPLTTTTRHISLPETPAQFVDLRLKTGLDPAGYFTQQKQVTVLEPGKPFALADAAGSRFEAYDSLSRVYSLFATLSRDPKLAEFAFVTTWPKLAIEKKREFYSKYACHELHFFLAKKDPEFFAAVVKPYLAHKKDKTFLDRFLLGEDVSEYVDPWKHGRLNSVERVLLAQRIGGELPKTARHLDELVRLLPPNPERVMMLFDTAVKSGALEARSTFARIQDGKEKMFLQGMNVAEKAGPVPTSDVSGGPVPGLAAPAPAKPGDPKRPANEASESLRKRDGRGDARVEEKLEKAQKESLDMLKDVDEVRDFREDDRKKLSEVVRQLYRKVDPTSEWAENNYYHLRIQNQTAALVSAGPFWVDYARHDGKSPFLSRNLADAGRNFTEMMFALAVLDLPFEAGKHEVKFADGAMSLTPAGPAIGFHEEVRKADGPDGKVPVLVGQNLYRHGDRFREENGEKFDKYVTGEFLIHTVYGCQVVVTNPTSTRQRLSVLTQLPVGALPVSNAQYTKTVLVDLEPYRTQTVEYQFYFPKAGTFAHFPAQVAKNERVVAAAKPATFKVVEKLSQTDTGAWDYVSQFGTDEEVLAVLARENVQALNLGKIAFRMRDRAMFEKTILLLKERHAYNPTLWSYGLYYNVASVAKECLSHSDQLAAEVGGPIDSPLFRHDPVERLSYEHLEYKPLVNARAHALGARRQIVNAAVHAQYHQMLKLFTYRRELNDTDLLAVSYHLLLQDRVEEAIAAFNRVNPEKVATKMQYDYCAAYLALYEEDLGRARAIASKHANHPVDKWRATFAAIAAQLDEAEGKGPKVADPNDKGQQQGQLAATEPGFEAGIDGKGVRLTWHNINSVRVNYYLMDVELLFSRTPFAQAEGGQFAFTKPNASRVVPLPEGQKELTIPLPDDLVKRNVLVEVTAAGQTRSVPYYASSMDVRLVENFGQVKVTEPAGKPLSKVYVKVYTKLANGTVKFHKDGYTDLRGRFDYATVSTPERSPAARFSVLVLSEDRGAVIREAAPPQQ